MSNKFEIHCVKIEKTQSSSSVQGEVRGGGMTINGTGGSSVRGRTDTVHTSQVTANGKMYMLKQKNASYPFSEGDDMVFLCKRNDKTGMYEIISLLNNSNGTRLVQSPATGLVYIWGMAVMSLITVLFVIGFILAPLAFGYAIYYTLKVHPLVKEATDKLLRLDGAKDKQTMEQSLIGYSGQTLISGYE